MIKISDLRMLEVVNLIDGKRLGNIIDIDLDMEKGRVLSFIMPGRVKGWSIFSRKEEVIVPWDKIVKIGKDVILVEVPVYTETGNNKYNPGHSLPDDDDF